MRSFKQRPISQTNTNINLVRKRYGQRKVKLIKQPGSFCCAFDGTGIELFITVFLCFDYEFFFNRDHDLCEKGIKRFPLKYQQIIQKNGAYFK